MTTAGLPPVVDKETWQRELEALRIREKAATRELDAIAAVAVGGTRLTGGYATVIGTLLGALIIQLVRYSLLANGVPDSLAHVVKGGIIVASVWIQQKGKSS